MSQKSKKIFKLLAVAIMILTYSACSRYYKAIKNENPAAPGKTVDSLQNQNRYFILRSGSEAYHMTKIVLSEDRQTLSCVLDALPTMHELYLTHGRDGKMKYKTKLNDDVVLNEVHLFIKSSGSVNQGQFTLDLNNVQKIEVIEKDKKRTTSSYLLGGLAIGAGVTAAIALIAGGSHTPTPISTPAPNLACSPQVYTVNNNESELNGTLCSGAIYASLKRTDYLPVNIMNANSSKLNLILKGEKNEELMMKDFRLIQVAHNAGQKILIDKNGQALAYEHPVTPEHAVIGAGKDVANDISAADEKYYSFTNEAENGSSNVVLDFKKPQDASSGRLIIKGKNFQWAYYVFNEFKKMYGKYYRSLILKKDKENPAKVLQCAIDQSLPLLVSVKDGNDWKLVDYFFTPGNAAAREMIMQLNLDRFKNADHIQIKLQTAYKFWDIDYTAMDWVQFKFSLLIKS